MAVYSENPIRQRLLNMGKKFGWFNKPSLHEKIEELNKKAKAQRERNDSAATTRSDLLFADNVTRGEIDEENNTGCDIIDCDNADLDKDFADVEICEDSMENIPQINQECSTDSQHWTKVNFSQNKNQEMEDVENTGTPVQSFERDSSASKKETELCNEEIVENTDGITIVEESCSYSNREDGSSDNDDDKGNTNSNDDDDSEYTNSNDGDDVVDDDDKDDEYNDNNNHATKDVKSPNTVEEGRTSVLYNSLEIDDSSADRSSSGELTRSSSRNEHSSDSTENTSISNSPVKVDELPGLDESYSHSNSDEHCDYSNADNGLTHADSDDDVYNDDDVNDQDEQYSDSEEEQAAMFNSDEINGDGECGILIDSTRTGSRNDFNSINNAIENISISDSPVKVVDHELYKLQESSSHSNIDGQCDSKDGNNEPVCIDLSDDDECNDGDANLEDIEEMQHSVTSPILDFDRIGDNDDDGNDGESNLPKELTRAKSSMSNNCSIEDVSPVKASLSARLFKKYNPEKSESDDVDDFELFLQKIRTPKRLELSDKERTTESSLNKFIVHDDDDDNEDQDNDVFCDPGFTPDIEEFFDDDKENEDCIEIGTPVTSNTPFKTLLTNFSGKAATKSTSNHTSFQTPSTDFSWRTPKTKPRCDSGLLSARPSRPKGVLEDLLTPYSTSKDFKKSKDKLVRDLFKLYNRTVFDNQLPSDFQITWNPRMRSTAGFCYYSKKNSLRMARIELADKVIDSADRLRDTLIHEMCHAAAWLVSGVQAGHGAVWKKWTLRANHVHQDLPPISRCHSYTINAKFTYRCTNNACANTFGRHSKSVNLEKSRCAYCHSRLELVPQLKKDGTPQTRTPSRFAMFVKENYARIKSDHETFSHQEVMKALSSEFSKLRT